ncbi:MAG: FHA domain-containing protein [Ruminococcus sp.]|nr:FHA domain-containing protein [Ruminococcus sp.]
MKKIVSVLLCVIAAVRIIPCIIIAAADSPCIMQYYPADDKITAYVSGIPSDEPEVRVSGVSCKAVNRGSLYNDSERYETYFLIDSSKSMQSFSDEIELFMRDCIDRKPDNEYYSIGLFASANTPEYIISGETKQYTLMKSLDNLKYDFNSTYIYDNLINVIKQLDSADDTCYKRIVLITDGNENSAKGITVNDVTDELGKNPIPVYTVTLQTSDKSNLDNLKNISRLARFTGVSDIRIADGENTEGISKVFNDDASDIYCIEITLDSSMLDGSVKAVQISDGTSFASLDMRMVMGTVTETSAETFSQTTVVQTETTTSAVISQVPEPKDEPENNRNIIVIAAAAVIVIISVTVIVCTLAKEKKKKQQSPSAPAGRELNADNSLTEILSGPGGQTEILIEGNGQQYRSVVLRDAADSVRTFEVQLSAAGAVIGRSADMADIVIDYDKAVSRKHCRIYLNGGKACIEDLGSGNKTFVNNSEVTYPCEINNADEIKVGRTRLKVTLK